jgi:hypothetical protein
MGSMTRLEIITQGIAEAGVDDTNKSLAETDLNLRLQRIYNAWPWPFLQKRASGVALAQGATSLDVGNGSGSITDLIRRILNPMYLYRSDYTYAGRISTRPIAGGPVSLDETINNPATLTGPPQLMKVRQHSTAAGKWTLTPMPTPDRAYLMALDYIFTPANMTVGVGGDASIPVYPNDSTMVKIVEVWALKYFKHETYTTERDVLADMVIQDRVVYGSVDGTNDNLALDDSVFL